MVRKKRDASGNKIETYTQADITNIARVFTGWDFDRTTNVNTVEPVSRRTIPAPTSPRLPMRLTAKPFQPGCHISGTTVPANTDGTAALRTALDALFNHPNVGPSLANR